MNQQTIDIIQPYIDEYCKAKKELDEFKLASRYDILTINKNYELKLINRYVTNKATYRK